jgi:hypothetical protein
LPALVAGFAAGGPIRAPFWPNDCTSAAVLGRLLAVLELALAFAAAAAAFSSFASAAACAAATAACSEAELTAMLIFSTPASQRIAQPTSVPSPLLSRSKGMATT